MARWKYVDGREYVVPGALDNMLERDPSYTRIKDEASKAKTPKDMTKAELAEYAGQHGVAVVEQDTKADIIEKLG